jgi:trk system potassium uptake protein TrkA
MNIIVIGVGTVGGSVAELLARQGHNLTVIDIDAERLRHLGDRLDLNTILDSGGSPYVLRRAKVMDTDLVLAMTSNDEVNLLTAQIARRLGAKKVLARVRKHEYIDRSIFDFEKELGIDTIISPELLAAMEIRDSLEDPNALTLGHFAEDRVLLQRISLIESNPYANNFVRDIDLPRGLLLVLVVRGEQIIIPRGDLKLLPNDKVSFLGLAETFKKLPEMFAEVKETGIRSVVMAGGGETGLYLARLLEKRSYKVKIIDADRNRCDSLSETLGKTEIIVGDVTNRFFLEEERIQKADVFVAVTGDEETNIMSALLAKELGVKRCIAKVNRPDYAKVIENVGIDHALSPRLITAKEILHMIKGVSMKELSLIEEGKVEVMEMEVPDKAAITKQPLSELLLPRECLVGMIVRQGRVKVPRGQDQVAPGDSVIMIALTDIVEKVEEFFAPGA